MQPLGGRHGRLTWMRLPLGMDLVIAQRAFPLSRQMREIIGEETHNIRF